MDSFKLTLPFPPSSNMAYPTGRNGRRFKSKRFKEWLKICPKLNSEVLDKASGKRYTVTYLIFFPDNRVRDGQSYLKLPLDYIVSQGVLEDDNRSIVCGERWFDGGNDKENPRIEIAIKEYKIGANT